MNKVTTKYTAIIDGQSTGLAGCKTGCCFCLRADEKLKKDQTFGDSAENCKRFIPINRAL